MLAQPSSEGDDTPELRRSAHLGGATDDHHGRYRGDVTGAVHHPIFARIYRLQSRLIERELGESRSELLAGLSGRVVEIGAGNGMNFGYYPTSTTEVVAIEPEPYLRRLAVRQAQRAPVPVSVSPGVAEQLPLADGVFDGAVASLVLCSVQSQDRALHELARVLRPGGELRFFEHVRSHVASRARVQMLLDRSRMWPLMAGGCECSRDTLSAMTAAGFDVEQARAVRVGAACGPTNPFVIGRARTRA